VANKNWTPPPGWGQPGPGQEQPPQDPPPPGYEHTQWQPPEPPKQKMGRGKKILIGVVIGFFVLVFIGAVAGNGNKPSTTATTGSAPSATQIPPRNTAPAKKAPVPKPQQNLQADAPIHPPEGDVKVDSCAISDAIDLPEAAITITNHSSKASNYLIELEFVNPAGTRLAEGIASADNLAPGQSEKVTATGTEQVSGKLRCRVTKVTRYAS
jgi:hypothetical protein